MLELKNLTKQYTEKNKATVTALSDVDLKFPKSGLIFILGKSGSGKSTLLNLIGGLDSPTKGEVIVDGRSTADFREADYDSYRNTYCGFVFQEYNLISNYTVGQNVALALELQREKCDRDKIDEILRRVELIDGDGKTLADRSVNQLSGGQKQRVAIARALIKEPKVILADEPTGALDCDTAQNFYRLLKDLSREKLIIVVTHDRVNAESYGDRVIELSDGRVVSDTVTSDAEGPMTDGEESPKAQTTAVRKGLPLKRKLSMGLAGLKVKPFRLVLSIILSLVAVVAFGFCMTTTVIDEYTTELLAAEQEGQRVAVLYNYLETEDATELSPFSEEQEEIIKEFTQGKQVNVLTDLWRYEIPRFMRSYLGEGNYYNLNPYREIALCEIVMGVELDPVTGEEDACLKPDDRFLDPNNCRLPSSDHEIAITDIRASMFMLFGYKSEDGETAEIKTPDDLIGKKLGNYSICGVFSTEQSREYYESYDYDNYDMDLYTQAVVNGTRRSLLGAVFLFQGISERTEGSEPTAALVKLSGNINQDKRNDIQITGFHCRLHSDLEYVPAVLRRSMYLNDIPCEKSNFQKACRYSTRKLKGEEKQKQSKVGLLCFSHISVKFLK